MGGAANLSPAVKQMLTKLMVLAVGQVSMYYFVKWMMRQMDPNYERKQQADVAAKAIKNRLPEGVTLTDYESIVSTDIIDPEDIPTTWKDVGGLDNTIRVLQESVVLPLTRPDLFPAGSNLLKAPRGVLLYGPPGVGKTLLARAVAKEAGCCFIALKPSTFMDKWYGESQKLTDALFTLASKLKPTIIFIDEIDAFLRKRSSHDQEMNAHMKAQFMTLWDGFSSDAPGQVVIIGATNRPEDVDKAFLRRMPRTCKIDLPGKDQRASILEAILRNENIEGDFDLDRIARATSGYSGNDLQELCRNTAMSKIRDQVQRTLKDGVPMSDDAIRLETVDFLEAQGAVENTVDENDDDWHDGVDALE